MADQQRVNLNTASKEEIAEAIKGIGDHLAENIVKYREKRNRINNFEELTRIPGIHMDLVRRLREEATL